jgi:hypothetical protein
MSPKPPVPVGPTPIEQKVIPFNGPAVRLTNCGVEFDGGSFVLRLYEQREAAQPRELTPAVSNRELVEIARYAVSPIALQYLASVIHDAARTYQASMGHALPNEKTLQAALQKFAVEEAARKQLNQPKT